MRRPPVRGLPRLSTLAALAALTAASIAGCGAAASSRPKPALRFPNLGYRAYAPHLARGVPRNAVIVVDMTNAGRVAPTALRFASDGLLSGAHWTRWGDATTTAHGTATVRVCSPNCGGGRSVRYPATMVLSGIRTCGDRRYYERARVTLRTVKGPRPWGAFIHAPCQ